MSSPEQQRLVENLRAAIERKQDPAERAALLAKLAEVERHFAEQPRLEREAAAAQEQLRSARRMLFWVKAGSVAAVVAIVLLALFMVP